MHELEKYKQALSKKFWDDNHNTEQRAVIQGFDAAIALDLPVKFAKWYKSIYDMHNPENDEENAFAEMNFKELYQYWLDNILKLE